MRTALLLGSSFIVVVLLLDIAVSKLLVLVTVAEPRDAQFGALASLVLVVILFVFIIVVRFGVELCKSVKRWNGMVHASSCRYWWGRGEGMVGVPARASYSDWDGRSYQMDRLDRVAQGGLGATPPYQMSGWEHWWQGVRFHVSLGMAREQLVFGSGLLSLLFPARREGRKDCDPSLGEVGRKRYHGILMPF